MIDGRFSVSMRSLNIQGAMWPHGSIETIFFTSFHCGNGPIFTAGSAFVKSGLILESQCQYTSIIGRHRPVVGVEFLACYSKSMVNGIGTTTCHTVSRDMLYGRGGSTYCAMGAKVKAAA